MVSPVIVYPMTVNDYYDVRNFVLYHGSEEAVRFSYMDLEERENTIYASVPYVMHGDLSEYTPDSDSINEALSDFYKMVFIGVKEMRPTRAVRERYGVSESSAAHTVYFEFDANYEDDNGATQTQAMSFNLYFSDVLENGNYYCYSDYSNLIVEIDGSSLTFLDWELTDWVDESIVETHLAHLVDVKIETANGEIHYELDNSATDQSQGVSANDQVIYMTTDFTDGTANFSGEITNVNGFRNFYQTLLYASLEGTLPEEARREAETQKNWIMTLEYTVDDGVNPVETKELKFYRYTSRKAFMTLNGQGAFYMLTDRVEKFWDDSIRVMNGEEVDPTAKH
jgi:hypothetical protein